MLCFCMHLFDFRSQCLMFRLKTLEHVIIGARLRGIQTSPSELCDQSLHLNESEQQDITLWKYR